jgi:biopolymer transport protein ExbB/TolQ
MRSVVLLSPNLYGDYSICVAELLWRRGIPTSAIFVRRMLNAARIRAELRQFGPRQLAKKIQRKLLFRNLAHKRAAYETIRDLREQEDIRFRSLRELAAAREPSFTPATT